MLFLLTNGVDRPNRLTDVKDDDYHKRWGRYCAYNANNQYHAQRLERTKRNKRFYIGHQWENPEDLEAFFKDDTGQNRNRIKMTKNIVRPMIEQFRGNAIRMNFNAVLKNISPLATNRRDAKLEEMKFFTRHANNNPAFGDVLRKKLPIGKTEGETAQIFENLWCDDYVERMNMLLKYVAELNSFEEMKVRLAEEMALSGIATVETKEYGGHQYFEIMRSEDFFFDTSSKLYDLTDAEYQGKIQYILPTEIFEQWEDISDEDREAIEKYAKQLKKLNSELQYQTAGRVPVVSAFWRDCEKIEYGYVMDEFGYPYLTKINYIEEGETEPKYTDEDLIDPVTERQKKLMKWTPEKKNKKRPMVVDLLRFCTFVPQEAISTTQNTVTSDLLLDWGIVPYQENDNLDFSNIKFPFKSYCWGYVDGEVVSPVDDVINPQRFINRILSVGENQINNSRGSGTMYDKDALDPEEGEEGMLRNMNQSKPVGMRARGRGMQNVIGSYDATTKQGTMVLFDIVKLLAANVQDVTGVNEALKGESTGSDQLVGVTELMIQRGSLMQEPFYNAIAMVLLQCYQSIATVGKRIYCDSERKLSMAVGDEGYNVISITKDMLNEDFRAFVKRDSSDPVLINAGNQLLTQLLQLQMIDQTRFANLYGRATPDQVAKGLRDAAKEKIEIARINEQKQEVQEKQDQADVLHHEAEQNQQQQSMMDREDVKDAQNRDHDMDKILAKSMGKMMENASNPNNAKQNLANTNY
jgi:hypothetical protein